VGPILRKSMLDESIRRVRKLTRPEWQIVSNAHEAVVEEFRHISGLDNRSLASKYLHFHCPAAVSIFDTRADRAIRHLTRQTMTRKKMSRIRGCTRDLLPAARIFAGDWKPNWVRN